MQTSSVGAFCWRTFCCIYGRSDVMLCRTMDTEFDDVFTDILFVCASKLHNSHFINSIFSIHMSLSIHDILNQSVSQLI